MAGPTGITPVLKIPYPVPDDNVDVPRDLLALASWLDADGGLRGRNIASQLPVLDVGMLGQVRAGRQLAVADFTAMGLAAPIGLFNLSNLSNLGTDGRALVNKGTVPFGVGINGLAATAAQFAGSTGQALYITDSGAADPYRIKTGSWGCWLRTAKRGTAQWLLTKLGAAGTNAVMLYTLTVTGSGTVGATVGDGASTLTISGVSDVTDDRWHFAVVAFDGTSSRIYVDGVLEASGSFSGLINSGSASVLNIGAYGADGSTAAVGPHYGRVDEAFVTADVLSEDQIRNLYCAKIAHGYATTPTRINLNVTRRKRGGTLAVADFPTQPLRLHNFKPPFGAAWLADEGSNNAPLTWNSGNISSGADGAGDQGAGFNGAGGGLSATDAGLPAALTARSYGCWFKTTSTAGNPTFLGYGGTTYTVLWLETAQGGRLSCTNGADQMVGGYVADGQWHFVVVVEDNAAGDGVKRKLYLDGRLVGASTVLNGIVLAGANRFRIGAHVDGTAPFNGQIDGAFVCGYALTAADIAKLYAKGSQALAPSPKNEGDHVEAMDATNVLATFDSLDSTALVDLGVSA